MYWKITATKKGLWRDWTSRWRDQRMRTESIILGGTGSGTPHLLLLLVRKPWRVWHPLVFWWWQVVWSGWLLYQLAHFSFAAPVLLISLHVGMAGGWCSYTVEDGPAPLIHLPSPPSCSFYLPVPCALDYSLLDSTCPGGLEVRWCRVNNTDSESRARISLGIWFPSWFPL